MTNPGPLDGRDAFSALFGHSWQRKPEARLGPGTADSCLRSVLAALRNGSGQRPQLADSLSSADLKVAVVESSGRTVDASIAVPATSVPDVRAGLADVEAELTSALRHQGWQLRSLDVATADPGEALPTAPPKRGELVEEIADTVAASKKAYEAAAFCDRVGMPSHPDPDADPYRSKRVYVRTRLEPVEMAEELVRIAGEVLEEMDSLSLQNLIDRYRPDGPSGPVKNLVFGSTSKPDLVLTDALSNDLALVNSDAAFMYDGGIPDYGLSWRTLIHALLPQAAAADERRAARQLYQRLIKCMGSEPERLFFQAYAACRYGCFGFEQPALIPQVWVHYDPRSRPQRGSTPVHTTQRMDFMLLLAGRRRVVLEVDGKRHYSDGVGAPSPTRYAEMVRDDRELRLRGYEVYRFGAAELPTDSEASQVAADFFSRLLAG